MRFVIVGMGIVAAFAAWDMALRSVQGDGADVTTIHGKVMCGYQGWFRCPGDAADLGWVHWSRDRQRITPASLTFEMWPDMTEYGADERFPAPGFAHADGRQAELFSSDNARTVLRHFEWMRDYGIDGAWLQRFLVGLPAGPFPQQYATHLRVLDHVARAAQQTDRVWAISYDMAQMPGERIFDALTSDWKKLVDDGVASGPRYLHQDGYPVVQIWGFYWNEKHHQITPVLANRLIDFFHAPGPYRAYLVGGGSWDWRRIGDPRWQEFVLRFDAYAPWNVGNYWKDDAGQAHASTHTWADDQRELSRRGIQWLPVVYPGFSWDNLTTQPPGTSVIPRRDGNFLWEQFHELSKLQVDSVYVAMFDEVDEGTAIFKVTSSPPTQGHFVTYNGLTSDWYLRLVGEAARHLHARQVIPPIIPITPVAPSTRFPEATQ
jgi:hypothetical protein